jgi:hypothetical protein
LISQAHLACNHKWSVIANAMFSLFGGEKRSGKQCRERWHNHLNPEIKKSEWSSEEKKKLIDLHETFGNHWSKIAENLPGRTDNSIKNCFYSLIRKNMRKYNRKKPECEKIKGSIKTLLKKPKIRSILLENDMPEHSEPQLEERVEIVRPKPILLFYSSISSPTTAESTPLEGHSIVFNDQLSQLAYNLYMMGNNYYQFPGYSGEN